MSTGQVVTTLYPSPLCVSSGKMRVLGFPLPDANAHPKTINAARHKAQHPPFEPQPEQAQGRPVKA